MVYTIIHIGKCGGGNLRKMVKHNPEKYNIIHLKQIKFNPNKKYIVLIRDPITRFVSAFNWKQLRIIDLNMMNKARKNEKKQFIYWDNANHLAENIYHEDGSLNMDAYNFIKNDCNQMQKDISFHLKYLLHKFNRKNCKVMKMETYERDFLNLFKEKWLGKRHKNNKKPTYLSEKAIINLKKFLKKDYECIEILAKKKCVSKEYYNKVLNLHYVLESPSITTI